MSKFAVGAIVILSTYLTACASIVSDNKRIVTLDSRPIGATVLVKNKAGQTVFNGTTPTSVTLPTSSGYFSGENYQVSFEAEGHDSVTTPISRSLNGWYFGNILLGGLIGMLIVDPITGAMWTLEDSVGIDLTTGTRLELPSATDEGANTKPDETLSIITLDQLPKEYHAYLLPVTTH